MTIITDTLSSNNLLSNIHYLIYRIDNIINGKHYTGKHITDNIYDDYTGSGILILKAIKKYGKDNFIKTILFDLSSEEDMNNKELELVLLSNCYPYDLLSYNLKPGGIGGSLSGENNPIYGKKFTNEHRLHISDALKGREFSEEHKKHLSESRKNTPSTWSLMSDDKKLQTSKKLSKSLKQVEHTDEWNKKISLTLQKRTPLQKQSQYLKFIYTLHNHTKEEQEKIYLNRSKSHKGIKIKDTTNMQAASKKLWNDPIKKLQMLDKRKLTYSKMPLEKIKLINLKKGSGSLKIVLSSVIKILKKYLIDVSSLDLKTFPIHEYKNIPKDCRTRRLFLIENWLKSININIKLVNQIVWATNGKENIKVDKNKIPNGYMIGLSHLHKKLS